VRLWSELSGWHRLEHWYRVSVHLRRQTCVRVKVLFVKVVLIGIFRVIAHRWRCPSPVGQSARTTRIPVAHAGVALAAASRARRGSRGPLPRVHPRRLRGEATHTWQAASGGIGYMVEKLIAEAYHSNPIFVSVTKVG
jgi:hypothetical protein